MKEYLDNVYPSSLKLKHTIDNGVVFDEDCCQLIDTRNAIKLIIEIDGTCYPKELVCEAVKEICQKAVEYYQK